MSEREKSTEAERTTMIIVPLGQDVVPEVMDLMTLGEPYITPRTPSDYWLYAALFSTSCLVARNGDRVVGAVIAFRSQDHPEAVYVQDVMVHPELRGRGTARELLTTLRQRAVAWGCDRMFLTSEPGNTAAHAAWLALGFSNRPGDLTIDGVQVISDFKGAGRGRAVYDLYLQ